MIKQTLALVGLTLAVSAQATTVDFGSIPNQANYTGNGDFNVATWGGPETDTSIYPHIFNGRLVNSSDPADPTDNYPTEDMIRFWFKQDVVDVSVEVYWAGNIASYGDPKVVAMDADLNVLHTLDYFGDGHYNFAGIEGIRHLMVDTALVAPREDWWYGVDSISYTTVPVPAAAWLFGSALIGLAGIKRKK